ncbi:hypothetical protein HJG60_009761 [Phyllostomus discolor]|uniref:Uncharacterized protein n=1 Tax=Phyllostomus discolor TaxID=89673 RepID=A0A834EQD5_9CHIR|nr:hypothetical protein HJG60_009761 [Phyllostomus discolor]
MPTEYIPLGLSYVYISRGKCLYTAVYIIKYKYEHTTHTQNSLLVSPNNLSPEISSSQYTESSLILLITHMVFQLSSCPILPRCPLLCLLCLMATHFHFHIRAFICPRWVLLSWLHAQDNKVPILLSMSHFLGQLAVFYDTLMICLCFTSEV